jgi:hypothetical protein
MRIPLPPSAPLIPQQRRLSNIVLGKHLESVCDHLGTPVADGFWCSQWTLGPFFFTFPFAVPIDPGGSPAPSFSIWISWINGSHDIEIGVWCAISATRIIKPLSQKDTLQKFLYNALKLKREGIYILPARHCSCSYGKCTYTGYFATSLPYFGR